MQGTIHHPVPEDAECTDPRCRATYWPLCAVAGGIVGSFIGFTFFDTLGALAGGLLGIVLAELMAQAWLRPAIR